MQKFLEGYKTWSGIILTIVGLIGLPSWISEGQLSSLLESLFVILGILVSVYGNYKSHKQIGSLKKLAGIK